MRQAATGGSLQVMDRDAGRMSGTLRRRLGGKTELVLFALGGGVLYVATVLVGTVTLGDGLPLLGWIGFAVASTIVLVASTVLAVFLVRSSVGVGYEAPRPRARRAAGAHRLLLVADEGCSGAALCRPLAERLGGRPAEVLVVAPALTSATRYLDSDSDAARDAAEARLAETLAAFAARGIRHGVRSAPRAPWRRSQTRSRSSPPTRSSSRRSPRSARTGWKKTSSSGRVRSTSSPSLTSPSPRLRPSTRRRLPDAPMKPSGFGYHERTSLRRAASFGRVLLAASRAGPP